jgi:hypothetical protein
MSAIHRGHAASALSLAVLGTALATGGCYGEPRGSTQTPLRPTNPWCPATDQRIIDVCYGCNPFEERIGNALSQTQIPEDVKQQIEQCLSGESNANVLGKDVLKASIKGCVEKKITLDPAYQKTLSDLVDKARQNIDPQAQKAWEGCRDNVRKCGRTNCPMPPSAFMGIWTGTIDGTSAKPRSVPLRGGIQLTVGTEGGTTGRFNICAKNMPSFIVRGSVQGTVDTAGHFDGFYAMMTLPDRLKLTGRMVALDRGSASGDFQAPTDSTPGELEVDAFHVDAKKGPGDLPEPCQVEVPMRGSTSPLGSSSAASPPPPSSCSMRCEGNGEATRLRIDAGRTYRFELRSKTANPHELHVLSESRNSKIMLVENSNVGDAFTLKDDSLKVCSKLRGTGGGCHWSCSVDTVNGLARLFTDQLSADFKVTCQ